MEAKKTPKPAYRYPSQPLGAQNQGQLAAAAQQALLSPLIHRTQRILKSQHYLPAPAPIQVSYVGPQNHSRLTTHQAPHREKAGLIAQSAYLLPPARAPITNGLM